MAQTCWKKRKKPDLEGTLYNIVTLCFVSDFLIKISSCFLLLGYRFKKSFLFLFVAYVLIVVCFSSWKLVAVIGIAFYAYKLTEHVIGVPINLPDYISSHPAITTLTVQPNTKSPYNNRLCVFFGAWHVISSFRKTA